MSIIVTTASSVSLGITLIEFINKLSDLLERALKSKVTVERVLLYLEAAQTAIQGLGIERQNILADARKCNIRDPKQTSSLWERLDTYLHKDQVSPLLNKAVNGLMESRESIKRESDNLPWRNRDKQAAYDSFIDIIIELESTLDRLSSNFFPGGSGMGVVTLYPIYDLTDEVRKRNEAEDKNIDYNTYDERLVGLCREALRDSSHEEWVKVLGKIEGLVAELHLAFRI